MVSCVCHPSLCLYQSIFQNSTTADSQASGGLDLILVPGLAFDKRGERLGHGRGYYDRCIAGWKASYPTRYGKVAPQTRELSNQALDFVGMKTFF